MEKKIVRLVLLGPTKGMLVLEKLLGGLSLWPLCAAFVHVVRCVYSAAPRQHRKGMTFGSRFAPVGLISIY